MGNILKILKEYQALLVIIPTVLGGLYQIINIWYYVGFPYIRYFSVSQVIPDGLIMVILVGWFVFVLLFTKFIIELFKVSLTGNDGLTTKIIMIIFSLLWTFTFLYQFYKFEPSSYVNSIMMNFAYVNSIAIGFFVFSYYLLNLFFEIQYELADIFTHLFFYVFLIIIILISQNQIGVANKRIINDDQFYNYTVLEKEIAKKHNDQEINLLYLSRDYLFYSIEVNGDKKILIEDAKKLIPNNEKN